MQLPQRIVSITLVLTGSVLMASPMEAQSTGSTDTEAIRRVVASAYIDGLHKNGSRAAIRAGFHPDFVMKVFQGDSVVDVTIEQWIARLPAEGVRPEHTVTHRVPQVDIAGRAAIARVEVMFDGRHVFTDYMSLYRFEDGWRIVAKIFNREAS